ncbi:beta-2-microglobulin [Xyrichtys novacula]|uniref:Beta-2-microglobulin n=1 Tax=Xyrichtys novacula TaxID=13765 RepID=A0AAV1F4E5_XYRNO|nr:beta-2-microglobulin [Xyrichtys novacula]
MKLLLSLFALVAVCSALQSRTAPKVVVYSRDPGEFGKDNTLICHVSNFYPPNLKIVLEKDGVELEKANQTDLAFNQNWHFHLTKSVAFKPNSGEKFICRVIHDTETKDYAWEPNM